MLASLLALRLSTSRASPATIFEPSKPARTQSLRSRTGSTEVNGSRTPTGGTGPSLGFLRITTEDLAWRLPKMKRRYRGSAMPCRSYSTSLWRGCAGQRIDSQFLAQLLDPDPAQSLLDFIDDPAGFRSRSDDGRLAAFSEQCKAAYRFDPADGELAAARQLGRAQGAWVEVWRRYRMRPDAYPNIGLRLRQARPDELLPERPQAWPQDNEQSEEQVRKALVGLASATEAEARAQIAALESEHGGRRGMGLGRSG